MNNPNKEKVTFAFKILLLGDSGVGKTALFIRYFDNIFQSNTIITLGLDYRVKSIHHKNMKINFSIWDTAGQDKFRSITRSYYNGASGILLMFDVTDIVSFNSIKNWLSQIKCYCLKDCEIILAGNKVDMEKRMVSEEDALALAKENGIKYIEMSVKENKNTKEVFSIMFSSILDKSKDYQEHKEKEIEKEKEGRITIGKEDKKIKNKDGCCLIN